MKWNRWILGGCLCMIAGHALGGESQPVLIVQDNREFSQEEVSIEVGERLQFENRDSVTHSLFSRTPGFEFNIPAQRPGARDVVRFDKAGTATVECAVHPSMRLEVHVDAAD